MDVRFRNHGVNERHVVDAAGQVRHQVAHPFAAVAVLPPGPGAFHALPGVALEQLDFFARIERLAVAANQLGLVIECIALAGRARHEELHHAFCLRRVMQTGACGDLRAVAVARPSAAAAVPCNCSSASNCASAMPPSPPPKRQRKSPVRTGYRHVPWLRAAQGWDLSSWHAVARNHWISRTARKSASPDPPVASGGPARRGRASRDRSPGHERSWPPDPRDLWDAAEAGHRPCPIARRRFRPGCRRRPVPPGTACSNDRAPSCRSPWACAHFAQADNQGFFQHSALVQVRNQRRQCRVEPGQQVLAHVVTMDVRVPAVAVRRRPRRRSRTLPRLRPAGGPAASIGRTGAGRTDRATPPALYADRVLAVCARR